MKSKRTKIWQPRCHIYPCCTQQKGEPTAKKASPEPHCKIVNPRRCFSVTQSWELPEELAELRMSSSSAQAPSDPGESLLRFTNQPPAMNGAVWAEWWWWEKPLWVVWAILPEFWNPLPVFHIKSQVIGFFLYKNDFFYFLELEIGTEPKWIEIGYYTFSIFGKVFFDQKGVFLASLWELES